MLILTYHAIESRPSLVSTTAAELQGDLDALREAGFAFVGLDELVRRAAGGSRVNRIAAVTFDDGYVSVATDAAPILEKQGIPAAVFVIAGRLGLDNAWPGQWSDIPRMPLATAEQVRTLADSGFTVAAHSITHRMLPSLTDAELRAEVCGSGDELERLTGRPVRYFAYPYGVFRQREVAVVRERYDAAFSARPGIVEPGADPYTLPRLEPHDLRLAARLGLLASPAFPAYVAARAVLRRIRRTLERRR